MANREAVEKLYVEYDQDASSPRTGMLRIRGATAFRFSGVWKIHVGRGGTYFIVGTEGEHRRVYARDVEDVRWFEE